MIEYALVDADIIAYRCAAVCENQDANLACWQTAELMRRIIHDTNAMDFKCYLTGANNFRYELYPEYKANRKDVPKPKHLGVVREYLSTDWKAVVTDGIEADDAMGIEQTNLDGQSIICSIDKDMLMIPGKHYNFVTCEERFVSPLEGMRHFYWQIIMGDRSDNIPGFDGKMRTKVPQKMESMVRYLDELTDEVDMYEYVHDLHHNPDMMDIYARLLWIQRKEGEVWQKPTRSGQTQD